MSQSALLVAKDINGIYRLHSNILLFIKVQLDQALVS